MTQQLGQPLTLLGGFYTPAGSLKSGLSDVTVTVWRAGNATPLVTGQACVEVGASGLYAYTLPGSDTGVAGEYVYVMSTADAGVVYSQVSESVQVGPAWVQHLDADVSDAIAATEGAVDPLTNPVPGLYAQGSGYSANTIYRLRLTPQAGGSCVYEIQGGPQYQPIGGASWSTLSPATSSSATATMYPGIAVSAAGPFWAGDVRVY